MIKGRITTTPEYCRNKGKGKIHIWGDGKETTLCGLSRIKYIGEIDPFGWNITTRIIEDYIHSSTQIKDCCKKCAVIWLKSQEVKEC